MEDLSLVIGLGNPGREYERTRHNAGFLLVEELARAGRADWQLEKKFQSRVATVAVGGRRVLLLQPQTYMNASGEAVGSVVKFYRVNPENLLVVVDDADLPLGQIRLRPGGSSGGHHGLDSVESHLGTRDYPRLRLGIGRRESTGREIVGHVLGRFSEPDWKVFEQVLERAAGQTKCWLTAGIQRAMNEFNGPLPGQTNQKPQ